MSDQDPKKPNNKWLALINIPIQMGAIIFAFAYFGNWLDENHPNATFFYKKILVMVGVAISFYNLNRQLKEINKSE
jgi:predicted MFS family arabinose efflux permease